jgi:pimeloyl-ACP methyl ester carboxylesterase
VPVLDLPQGPLNVRDTHPDGGPAGPPLVLLHGVLVDGRLWDPVVERLRDRHRLVALDLPLGAHRRPMPEGADLSPPGIAALVAAALDALDLRDVVLVGNDSGGAFAQITAARHPERLAGLALTNCDVLERFPPPLLRPLVGAARVGALGPLLRTTRLRATRAALMALVARRYDPALARDWMAPLADPRILRDAVRVFAGVDARHTLDAARLLRGSDLPVLLAWAMGDPLFPARDARRLAAQLPHARLVELPGDRTFVMLDQPAATSDALEGFVATVREQVQRRMAPAPQG